MSHTQKFISNGLKELNVKKFIHCKMYIVSLQSQGRVGNVLLKNTKVFGLNVLFIKIHIFCKTSDTIKKIKL